MRVFSATKLTRLPYQAISSNVDISRSVELPKNHDELGENLIAEAGRRVATGVTGLGDNMNREDVDKYPRRSDLRGRVGGVSTEREARPASKAPEGVTGGDFPLHEAGDAGVRREVVGVDRGGHSGKDINQDAQRAESLTAARMMIRDMNPAYSKLLSRIEQLKCGQLYKSDPSLEPSSGKVLGGVLSQRGLCRGAEDFRMGTEGRERLGGPNLGK